jgi:hypothetical protein
VRGAVFPHACVDEATRLRPHHTTTRIIYLIYFNLHHINIHPAWLGASSDEDAAPSAASSSSPSTEPTRRVSTVNRDIHRRTHAAIYLFIYLLYLSL